MWKTVVSDVTFRLVGKARHFVAKLKNTSHILWQIVPVKARFEYVPKKFDKGTLLVAYLLFEIDRADLHFEAGVITFAVLIESERNRNEAGGTHQVFTRRLYIFLKFAIRAYSVLEDRVIQFLAAYGHTA